MRARTWPVPAHGADQPLERAALADPAEQPSEPATVTATDSPGRNHVALTIQTSTVSAAA